LNQDVKDHSCDSVDSHHSHNPEVDRISDAYRILKEGKGLAGDHVEHHDMPIESIREFVHKNHKVSIKTTYEILVDGKRLTGHIYVDDFGNVSCHSFPTYSFSSTADLIKKIIDKFPQNLELDSEKKEKHQEHGSH